MPPSQGLPAQPSADPSTCPETQTIQAQAANVANTALYNLRAEWLLPPPKVRHALNLWRQRGKTKERPIPFLHMLLAFPLDS